MLQDNIQNSFNATLVDSNLIELGSDMSEVFIDSLMEDGILKDVFIVGTIVKCAKLGANIKDRLFLKKILSFLTQLKDVSPEQRKLIIEKIDSSKEYRVKVGEKLLYIIDSCEDYESSELVGVLFKSFVKEKITYKEFQKASSVIQRLNINDFRWFIKERKNHYFSLDDVGDLISSGLFELYYDEPDIEVKDQDDHKATSKYKTEVHGGGMSVHLSRTGEVILEVFCPSYEKRQKVKI